MIISPHDPELLAKKLLEIEFLARINPFALSSKARVRSRWKRTNSSLRHWLQIPLVQDRRNQRITGRPDIAFKDLVCQEYWNEKKPRDGLALGCGDGASAIDWANRGSFSTLLGLDISQQLVAVAQENVRKFGRSDRDSFKVADVNDIALEERHFDVVIFEQSLHHFKDVPSVLSRVRKLLRPGGLLIIDEFIGPRRFQWTTQQLAFCDAILLALPEAYRRSASGSNVKTRNLRVGELLMWLNDPSEAIESDRIESEVLRQFKLLRRFDYGGTIAHLVFHDIAHNFVTDDPEGINWGRLVLDAEEMLLSLGLIKSDFVCFVCTTDA